MRFKEVLPNIYYIKFKTQKELCSTFLRFQEYYESPKFRNKIFTLKEFKKWYTKNSKKGKETNNFTYYSDWSGFNIPSSILKPFYNGKFNPLSRKEKTFLDLFTEIKGDFYIIGTYGIKKVVKHEIAHGLFYVNSSYKKEILRILNKINKEYRDKINNYLSISGGYHECSWEDEPHAYLLTNAWDLLDTGIDKKILIRYRKKLNKIYKIYS